MSAADPKTSSSARFSLNDLRVLNDEIAALTRAGLPLEQGLREVGRDLSGNVSSTMRRMADRMGEGASLSEALAREGSHLPPIYRAVVGAGLRAGRLSVALESLAGFIRCYDEARMAIGLALWYPLIVLALAYTLFIAVVTFVIPRIVAAFDSLRVPRTILLNVLEWLGETCLYWGPIVPALLVLLGFYWVGTGRASSFHVGQRGLPLAWLPWMRSLVKQFEAANFAELLAILVEHGVPLPEGIKLASEASGDPRFSQAGRELSASVEGGGNPRDNSPALNAFPPLLRWLLADAQQRGTVPSGLRQISAIYRKRAAYQAEKIKVFLPMVFLLAIGMSATLLYGLTLFLPFSTLLRGLAHG